ncbi:tRNA lysidine(34) synthetase TilS [Alteribacillus sp. YIM 98480]|uniref:tRNA lysidine(34) synthetase TilS n=1 Tax=Alteribacillus sp. YIM 98480 TaxID=2606599 RepID=UPI00131ACC92|nr:tRNA lysidine(34) synthetase TilS [Alteribacillus sp. YIM 98480]
MKQIVKQWINERELLKNRSKLLAAVSGGPDSMALLHLLLEFQQEWKLEVAAAHINHGLREKTASEDEKFVRTWCRDKGVPYFSKQVDVKEALEKEGGTVQEQARRLRYEYLQTLMSKYKLDVLATGHHADDQMETMLMKQTTGRAVLGEAGIASSRPFGKGKLIRPLLCVTKEEILRYCHENNISFRTDESNSSDKYTRNRFRHSVLPFLKKENKSVHQHFQDFLDWESDERQYIESLAEEEIQRLLLNKHEHSVTISADGLIALPIPLQRRGIHLILKYLCYSKIPELSILHIKQLIHLLHQHHPSFTLDWPGGVKVSRSYNSLRFTVNNESKMEKSRPTRYLNISEKVSYDDVTFTAQRTKNIKEWAQRENVFICKEGETVFPLIIRTWKAGDKIQPLGMKGTKKVNRIFIDKKIPQEKRNTWPVLTDSTGEVLWVPYLKRSSSHVRNLGLETDCIAIQCKGLPQ